MERPAFDDIYMELAVNLAKRSHCIKRHVGAVLTKDTRIISCEQLARAQLLSTELTNLGGVYLRAQA